MVSDVSAADRGGMESGVREGRSLRVFQKEEKIAIAVSEVAQKPFAHIFPEKCAETKVRRVDPDPVFSGRSETGGGRRAFDF